MKSIRIKDAMLSRRERLIKLIESCNQFMENAPDGRLRIQRLKKTTKYYKVTNNENYHNGNRIAPEDSKLIHTLAQKNYCESVLKSASDELSLIEKTLSKYPDTLAEDTYEQFNNDRKKLINPIYYPDEELIKRWMIQPYKPKGFKEGTPEFTTMRGERVRSKSEQIIADRLYVAGIPYKYECPLVINGEVIYPDFTILRMSDREEIYLEHCGKMDDEKYVNDLMWRFKFYASGGILLGSRLYATFETRMYPLDAKVVDKMIDDLFR
ncbi:MAG: hypothetical protein IJ757_09385 [Clostridiales bacterium]|nr:hypothetical protein [Clostridiales bacterium]